MILRRFVNGWARANAYVFAPQDADCLIVDPGPGAAPQVLAVVEEAGLRPQAILLTHGHPDHTWTARLLSERLGVPAFLHRADWRWLEEPASGGHLPLVSVAGRLAGRALRLRPASLEPVGERIDAGALGVEALHTPGHTAGSVCYRVGEVCFCGDTLFRGAAGHTVYPGGNRRKLLGSLALLWEALEDEVRLLPGHGEETTMAAERSWLGRLAGRG